MSITDDSASSEPNQTFSLEFKDKPNDVELNINAISTIVIMDDESEC